MGWGEGGHTGGGVGWGGAYWEAFDEEGGAEGDCSHIRRTYRARECSEVNQIEDAA